MVASNPMDVAKDQARPRPDEASTAAPPASPSSESSLRPRLPAERDINNAMNGFNAGVVNFLKSEQTRYEPRSDAYVVSSSPFLIINYSREYENPSLLGACGFCKIMTFCVSVHSRFVQLGKPRQAAIPQSGASSASSLLSRKYIRLSPLYVLACSLAHYPLPPRTPQA